MDALFREVELWVNWQDNVISRYEPVPYAEGLSVCNDGKTGNIQAAFWCYIS